MKMSKYLLLLFCTFFFMKSKAQVDTLHTKASTTDTVSSNRKTQNNHGLTETQVPQSEVSSSDLIKKTIEQSNCATIVKDAEVLYNNGDYDACLALLQKGLTDCRLTKREKEEAWILKARVNIEKDNIIEVNHS